MKVTITEEHLDKAIRAKRHGISAGMCCPVYQAANGKDKRVWWCGRSRVELDTGEQLALSDKAINMVRLFDTKKYAQMRRTLPVTVQLRKVGQ